MADLSHSRLCELLAYDPASGIFIRKIATSSNAKVGDQAGVIDKTTGRRRITVEGRRYWAAPLAWFYVHGEWPSVEIDHINRNRADDRISNLRAATRGQNSANRAKGINNNSGVKGVSWDARSNGWRVRVGDHYVGVFGELEFAAAAYAEAAQRVYGEFANV